MPNWAMGVVAVTGTKENVIAFCKHFICEGEEGNRDERIKLFYRSFHYQRRDELEKDILGYFPENGDSESMASVDIDFAWSAESCLINHGDDRGCISLVRACMLHQVDVTVMTKEPGIGFEESITGNRSGVVYNCEAELKTGRCRCCGNREGVASFENLDEYECSECGRVGFDLCEDLS